ncbi:hypothetical protein CYLTODRAFT_484973 [Cylindrobasidium torrendii FP15055 ss-10]|uniref:DUF676 domain-containing protein n=1 Tax=Cylindrobasidium torrendii FP15055 ss-10 TaxID=1314674 RepID=A0A0D7BUA7_9AGAR|nr:hypothetical protein CYLTODRAFT_484973 [Cylindrobasidium torrendii FP15055 ss-10]
MSKTVHIIYVHGFNGDETTFQSFPMDMQHYLTQHIPPQLGITVKSSLYPTYKSRKSIATGVNNILHWLNTQPSGPVILIGHSMGGLLVAEAATHMSNNPSTSTKPRRIMGVIAFDTPYLGMHPHVVVTGIQSLFQNDADKKTESEVNDDTVNIVDKRVTNNWDEYKKSLPEHGSIQGHGRLSPLPDNASSTDNASSSRLSLSSRASSILPSPSSSSSPSSLTSRASSFLGRSTAFLDKAQDRALTLIDTHADEPLVRWLRKHSDEPFSAAKTWGIEHFQFGSSMFDPAGLKKRYTTLVAWKGPWVNYWTVVNPQESQDESTTHPEAQEADNNQALLENGMVGEIASEYGDKPLSKDQEKQLSKLNKTEKDTKKPKVPRHFVVLPNGIASILGGEANWEKVVIGGVKDEVGAHVGLFIRGQNLDYDGLVDRVGQKLISWMRDM